MRKFLSLFILLCTGIFLANAQVSFSYDQTQFMKDLGDFMKANNNEIGKNAYDAFKDQVDAGNITADQIDKVIDICNRMGDLRLHATPAFVGILNATVAFSKSGFLPERYDEWMKIVNSILENSRNGSYSTYNKFLEFSVPFFEKSALNETPSKTWMFGSFDYELKLQDNVPEIDFASLNILAFTRGDTLSITNTAGVYYPLDQKWIGQGGTVNWSRAGLDSTTIYATLRHYAIDMARNEYVADSVLFYYAGLFQKPLLGQLTDRLVTNNEPDKSDVPQFLSYTQTLTIPDIIKNVDYKGGFLLKGSRIIGSGTDSIPAIMTFRDPYNKPAVQAKSQSFLIKPELSIYSDDAQAKVFVGKDDSIYHHDVTVNYNALTNTISLTRQKEGFSSLMFYSSYHKIDAKVDQINWTLGDTTLLLKNISGAGSKMGYFESQDLYSDNLYNSIQGISSYQPLVKIKRYCERNQTREIPSAVLARELVPTLTVDGIQSLLLGLVKEGFIFYDKPHEMVYVKDKTFNYAYAASGHRDYDIIDIPSQEQKPNAQLDLKNYDLQINGVPQFYLSDSQFVLIYPKDDKVIMKKNRDMFFDGTVVSGNIDFIGKDFYFSYDTFNIKMNAVDSMILYVESTEVDDNGNPLYLPVRTNISLTNGRLQIDKADNKSSKVNYPDYSIFTTYSYSKADYDRADVFDHVYEKDQFYFQLDPFTLKSVDSLDYRKVKFDGTMISDGIFPDFRESLKLQEDRSLGFKTQTPPAGYPMYGGKGTYHDKIFLSNEGFKGDGDLDFMASHSHSKNFTFFPDSTTANVDAFAVTETKKGVEFPDVKNSGVQSIWVPDEDRMTVTQGATPFNMYDSLSTLTGVMTVSSKGLTGNGIQKWGEVTLFSDLYRYASRNAKADTASVTIGQVSADVVALRLGNVKTNIDFDKRIGNFKSNFDTVMTELPYNQYKTDMNEFDWIEDTRTIHFKSTHAYSNFYSTNKTQDSLYFQAKGGRFTLADYVLAAEGVPFIAVGDAHVIPDSGKVFVEAAAKMRPLDHAVIIADTIDKYHTIQDATVNINGRFSIAGTGNYAYVSPQGKKENIFFDAISIKSVTDTLMGIVNHQLFASGYIGDSVNFVLEDKVHYKGPVELHSQDKFLRYRGYVKLDVSDTANYHTDWFRVDAYMDPANPVFNLDDASTESHDSVYAGIFKRADSINLYATVMSRKYYRNDPVFFIARGKGMYDEKSGTYYFGNLRKIDDPAEGGSLMQYNDNTGAISAVGSLSMGIKTDVCESVAYGTIEKTPDDSIFHMNATIGIALPLPDDLMKKLSDIIFNGNGEAGPIDYSSDNLLINAIPEIADKNFADKILAGLDAKGYLERPKDYPYTLLLSGLQLVWDETTRSFHTTGSAAQLVWIGDQQINQDIKVYADFGKRSSGDYFTIYMETDNNDFVYITYKKNQMKLFTSDEDVNTDIFSTDSKKRIVETDHGNLIYMLEGKNTVSRFVESMESYDPDSQSDN